MAAPAAARSARPVRGYARGEELVSPKILEPIGRQRRIAHRGHDRAVAEIGLDSAGVVAVVRELEPTSMPQHVRVDKKGEFRRHARPGHHALISGCGKRSAAFRDEDVGRFWCFAYEFAQSPTFPRRYRMHAGITVLGPTYMQAFDGEVDVALWSDDFKSSTAFSPATLSATT